MRVLRSLIGRADAGVVAKAARLAGIDVAQFWAGPSTENDNVEPGVADVGVVAPDQQQPHQPGPLPPRSRLRLRPAPRARPRSSCSSGCSRAVCG